MKKSEIKTELDQLKYDYMRAYQRLWEARKKGKDLKEYEKCLASLKEKIDKITGLAPGHRTVHELDRSEYKQEFVPTKEYLDSMPDLQNSQFIGTPIDFVGIEGLKIPLKIRQKEGGTQEVICDVTGTVSLDAAKRGINMSRILRTLQKTTKGAVTFDINDLEKVLKAYQKDLETFDAHILMNFQYRLWQPSLRSVNDEGNPNGGWQYYNVTFDTNLDVSGEFKKIIWIDYVYSSACPCSTELSMHAQETRGVYAIPHSQRSVARLGLEMGNNILWIEDIIHMCKKAIPTETQVFVKREDEQAFAEMNGANTIFVEDAVRKLGKVLEDNSSVMDFKIICSHYESLHSHQAISVITRGRRRDGGVSIFNHHVTFSEWKSLK